MPTRTKASPRDQRIVLTVAAAVSTALVAWVFWSAPHTLPSDVAQVWAGARAFLHGQSPYQAVGPGRAFEFDFPLFYPMTAIVILIPLAPLPLRLVDPLFVGLSFALFTWAITRKRLHPPALVALFSVAAAMTVRSSQWSVLLTGAALLPAFGWLLIAKPTIGLALFAAYPHWKTAAGCIVLLLLSLLVWPGWVKEWRSTFPSAPHIVAPVTRWGGPLLFLALLKWRRPDARLLVALACVPHTTALYETIPLFLIPRTWPQAFCLWALGLSAFAGQKLTGPYLTQAAYWASGAQWIVALLYLPCLAIVLCRPNVWSEPDPGGR